MTDKHFYGWKKQQPDIRDHQLMLPSHIFLPSHVDMHADCPPIWSQGQLGCMDDKSEVLTGNGWKPWPELTGDEILGTMHPVTHQLEFQAPLALHAYEYDGPLYYINHRSLDFALTPNHRMYVRPWIEGPRKNKVQKLSREYKFTEISNIGWYVGLPHATSGWIGTELQKVAIGGQTFQGDDLVALIAILLSDGWAGGQPSNADRLGFCCFNEKRYPSVAALANRLGIGEQPSRKGYWYFRSFPLAEWMRQHGYAGIFRSPYKRVPDLIKQASQRQISHFLDFYGDQHIQDGARAFYTSSKWLKNDLQELLLRIGKRGSICERAIRPPSVMRDGRKIMANHPEATIIERSTERLSIERKRQIETDHYKGTVFCATVPNGILVTRRSGTVLISGNSCTAHGTLRAYCHARKVAGEPVFMPSRLLQYYDSRALEGTVLIDVGATTRDAIKSTAQWGACDENLWPYDISRFNWKPPDTVYAEAAKHKSISYQSVAQNLYLLKAALANGHVFVFGFTIYENFETDSVARSGLMPLPEG